ncbi:MAG: DGQHR domain-containing protein [Chryseobacterium jejuense]|uniref:DGQHR domain-containing protein n=1 Tax=Chryseobacterium jejuense TaxID=445960 RepID=UPI003D0A13B5
MKIPGIEYHQSNYRLISTVIPFNLIYRKSKTLIYGIDEEGYQRKQDEKHYQNIKKYIESYNFVFPNSIILAIDEEKLERIITHNDNELIFLTLDDEKEFLFRVVDGQHRLLGIEKASLSDIELLNLKLQVSIIVTPKNRRSIELDIFSNINSKAKRLKTDLIELAKYDFRILEEKIGTKELNPHIAINIAYNLNEKIDDKDNIWQNAIKIDIHSENKIGIIGVTAFSESIYGIINSYLELKKTEVDKLDSSKLIHFSKQASLEISDLISKAWLIVKNRWPKAFLSPHKILDIDNQYKTIIYDPNFYIQKTLGCKSINYLLTEILQKNYKNHFDTKVLHDFEKTIINCKLNDYDWKIGKTLSGISSESGFRKVTRILKNEEEFIRKE